MKKTCISKEWIFSCPEKEGKKQIDLPHDYVIELPRDPKAVGEGATGYYTGTTGEYVKYMQFGDDEHVILDVDGAYMCSRVFLNCNMMELHPYGYTPFLVDLTSKMRKNEINKLVITTQSLEPSSRWYSGAGLYRDVFLWTGGPIRIEPRDVFVTTKEIRNDKAVVSVVIDVTADYEAKAEVELIIKDANKEIVKLQTGVLHIKENTTNKAEKNTIEFTVDIENPKLWDIETPYQYQLIATIRRDEEILDTAELLFGVRTVTVNVGEGLLINGKPVKLKGGCIHSDHGGLGTMSFPAAERRKIQKLKEAGYNAVRISHHPPSLALLDVCDEIGMFVLDEAFDMWRTGKNRLDYSLWFEYCWANDIKDMILRDRNHPSVIMYSVGNEIPERINLSNGAEWMQKLVDEVKKYDTTKPITAGVNEIWEKPDGDAPKRYLDPYSRESYEVSEGKSDFNWGERTAEFTAPLDVVGYNYLYERYERDHELFPKRIMCGTETHALNIRKSWASVMRNPYVIGDFTWTACDNLGEAGAGKGVWSRDGVLTGIRACEYPWRTCYQGDFDLCGHRRPQSYFREVVWKENLEPRIFTTHPEHYGETYSGTGWHWYDVWESWTFEDKYIGCMVQADVYTDADEIEFILNGRILGRVIPKEGIASKDIAYEKGELTAISYKGGVEQKRHSLHTVGAPQQILLNLEQSQIAADNRDLCYVNIQIADETGRDVPYAECELDCMVDGGELLTIFSANPANEDDYNSGRCHTFDGKALAVIRSKNPGDIKVTVASQGLQAAQAIIKAEL